MNPSKTIVNEWLTLVKNFQREESKALTSPGRQLSVRKSKSDESPSPAFSDAIFNNSSSKGSVNSKDVPGTRFDKDIPGRIAIHCLAGLGR